MSLSPGSKLGPYEVLAPLGAGGMGEVYRARDSRLGREVAIKVLPESFARDADRLRRFEQEARAIAALNHPNILAIHDIGSHEGCPYLVSELLEGETLRKRLADGAMPSRKAVDYGLQIAQGLGAAHSKGIVHRDLKPENLFLTKDGRVKILDFGLAKLTPVEGLEGGQTSAPTTPGGTNPGVVLGTVGYMSPEQVRGQAADHRSDIFTLGTIFYEMLCGQRAFERGSSVETMNAILKEDPADSGPVTRGIPPALERVVRRCLEKNVEERFQSARDLAFALEAISAPSGVSGPAQATKEELLETPTRRRGLWVALASLAVIVVALGSYILGGRRAQVPQPVFRVLTFRRGWVHSAKFAPDGQSVIYAASWDGSPMQLFSVRPGGPESRPLDFPPAAIYGISSSGDLALSLGHRFAGGFISYGTLARAPMGGGAPRELLEKVQGADWSPDGTNLAVIREVAGRSRLEFPVGKVLYETAGWISHPRVSAKGDLVAFLDHPVQGDDGGFVAVVDLSGRKQTLSGPWLSEYGLAWGPSGVEIWFTATKVGNARALQAVSLSGRERTLARVPGVLNLLDVSRDGRALVTRETARLGIMAMPPGATKEKDLSWFDWSLIRDMSQDGRTILFDESGEAGGETYAVYIRKTDGSPAVRLGDGTAMALSPDGKWAIGVVHSTPPQLMLLPTGPGEAQTLNRGPLEQYHWAGWFPDGKRIIIAGNERGHAVRAYAQELDGSPPRAITPEGSVSFLGSHSISPDGKWIAATDLGHELTFYPTEGGASRMVPGLAIDDRFSSWGMDSRSIFVFRRDEIPARVFHVDIASGKKELWKELMPVDPAGLQAVLSLQITPDAKSYAYSYARDLSELYLVEGLK